MARSAITAISSDLQTDAGSVLWSFIQGEQLEFPITLSFLSAVNSYTYEAVVVEADNINGDNSVPSSIKVGGHATQLNVRIPPYIGTWVNSILYYREDVVLYNGVYYKAATAVNLAEAAPDTNAKWAVYVPNKVYIQFPLSLSIDWVVQPTVTSSVYGFFELRVTEPDGGIYTRTWKPVRGIVDIKFSPTAITA